MFSLIPKTDAGLWLGPLYVQSTSSSLSIQGHLVRADVLFWFYFISFWFFFPVLVGSLAVMWTVIMHLREFRLLIHCRYLLSPALLSPHHITHPKNQAHFYRLLPGSHIKVIKSLFSHQSAGSQQIYKRVDPASLSSLRCHVPLQTVIKEVPLFWPLPISSSLSQFIYLSKSWQCSPTVKIIF